MNHVGDVLFRQGNKLLNDKKYAMFCVAICAILPFTFWLSASIVALVTLRKGKEAGFNILLPAMVASFIYMYTMIPLDLAIVNVLVRWLPVYLGACILRNTANWSFVFGGFFLLILGSALLLQMIMPDLILAQYRYFQEWFSSYPELVQLTGKQAVNAWSPETLAHLFFGIQITFSLFSVALSLLFARFVQAKLFLPGAFQKELITFRSGKYALVTLVIALILAWFGICLAIDILPLMFFYFLMSGFLLSFLMFEKKKMLGLTIFLVSFVVNPAALIILCVAFGILDSLFNFRMYLSAKPYP